MNSTVGLRRRGGLGKRFGLAPLVALLLVAVLGAGFLFVRTLIGSNADTELGGDRQPPGGLTDREASERFDELQALLAQTYERADVTLLTLWMAPDSPRKESVLKDLRTLHRNNVSDQTSRKTLNLAVTFSDPGEVRLEQQLLETPKFVSEATGKNVTIDAVRERQTVRWIMRRYGDQWLLYDSVISNAEPLRS